MKNYYAFNYPAGLAVSSKGERYGAYHAFPSRSLRDKFVAEGNDYITGPNFREAVKTSDPELRSALREASVFVRHFGACWVDALYRVNIITE